MRRDSKGTYIIVAELPRAQHIQIRKRTDVFFERGVYLYIGSAQGPGGLHARVGRHLAESEAKTLHWDIDFLLDVARPIEAWAAVSTAEEGLECTWATSLASMPGTTPATMRFGARDCRRGCVSHLVRFDGRPSLTAVKRHLGRTGDGLARFSPKPWRR